MRRSIRSAKFNAENKTTLKTLTVATIAGLSIIGVGQAQATTLDEVDLSQKPIDTPTLDYLHDKKVLIPQKTFQRDEDGNIIINDSHNEPIIQEGTPILAPQSGYSLTKLEANPDGSKPDGDNVITKFEVKEVTRYYDKTTGELVANPISGTEYKVVQEKDLVPQYYNVNTIIPESNNSKITWTEVTERGDNTITISSPDGTPKYYKYTYNAPSDYDTTTNSNKTKDLGTITNPTGTTSEPSTYKGGAAINNPAGSTINIENYVFQNNKTTAYFESTTYDDKYVNLIGGAIYNEGEISKITSDFIGNSVSATTSSYRVNAEELGGAIYNNGKIGDITGDFIKNHTSRDGGAIYNAYNSTIDNITSNFIRNSANCGGAIDNKGIIENITSNFIGNSTQREGGAIDNNGIIENITSNFIGNSTQREGGAIYNYYRGTIGNITGDFIMNHTSRDGGAIYNDGTIYNIIGDFIGNEGCGGDWYPNGGAIYNLRVIGNIGGDFISNRVKAFASYYGIGGAIYNGGDSYSIENIIGNFIGNYAEAENGSAIGGAIGNTRKIDTTRDFTGSNITGNFIENYAKSENGTAMGGAIANNLAIDIRNSQLSSNSDITSSQNPSILNIKNSSFINNYASGNYAYGGAIYNDVSEIVGGGNPASLELADNTITTSDYGITLLNVQNSSFENNNVSGKISALGGAIANEFHISNRNIPQEDSLASETNTGKYNINISNSTFNNNTAYSIEEIAAGGAIYNSNMDLNILGSNFTNNSAVSEQGSALGGAIAAQNPRLGNSSGTIEVHYGIGTYTNSNTGESITLYGSYCQEFDEDLTLQENIDIANSQGITVNFIKEDDYSGTMDQDEWNSFIEYINEQKEKGYASENDITQTVTINNPNTDEIILASNGDIKTITNSSFINNHATSTAGEAKGGAIYSNRDLNIVADGTTSVFKNNYTESKGIKDDNAIYIDNNATLNFTMKNNGKIYMADNIDGTVTKDSDGNITKTYNVNIKGDNINNTTFYMLNDIRNANVTFDNTTINAINNQTHVYNFNTLTVNSDTNFVADVDLANEQMDRITANNYGTHNGNLNVVGMNLLSDSTKDVTEIYFAQPGLKK